MVELGAAENDPTNVFTELLLELHAEEGVERTVEVIVERARSALLCDEAGVLLVERGKIETAGATSETVRQADELQRALEEGPCLSSIESGDLYVIEDMGSETRWPRWARGAAELGFGSLISVPLATRDHRLGSINLFSRQPGAFDENDVSVAHVFSRHAALAVEHERHTHNLLSAIDSRKLIGQAQGILMERHGLDAQRAFQVLARYSQDGNVKLVDLAREVIATRRLPA